MPKVAKADGYFNDKYQKPSESPEARTNKMIALALDLVEHRLRNGTASSQETTHFLELASEKHQLQMDKLTSENRLINTKIDALKAETVSAELSAEALRAFKEYQGEEPNGESEQDL